MYKKASECAALHTLSCDHSNSQAAMVNQSMYVAMATYGERCMEKYGMTEEEKCWMKEPCTMWIENCIPEKSDEICRYEVFQALSFMKNYLCQYFFQS